MLNCVGRSQRRSLWDILPEVGRHDTPLIVNISAGTAEEYGELAAQLDVDGVAALEVNISCPNVKEGGIVFGTDPKAAASVARSKSDRRRSSATVAERC